MEDTEMRASILRGGAAQWSSFLDDVPHDFYHLPAYTSLAAAQEGGDPAALLVEDEPRRMLLPLVIRPIHDVGNDATSPYGYPGPLVAGSDEPTFLRDALIEGTSLLGSEGIVSLFVRFHPLLNRSMPDDVGVIVNHGDTVSIDLTQPSEVLWSQTRANHRTQINRSIRAGHRVIFDTDWERFDAFKSLYRGTMRRISADAWYLFDDGYFDGLREALGERLKLVTVEIGGTIAAAALFVETCGIVEYHLSGTDERFARQQPTKLMFHVVRAWAKERGNRWFHLGGGVGAADDSLLHFKAGFSSLRFPFHTLRVVIMEDEYARLVAARDPSGDPQFFSGFFPAYRVDPA
jgi:hypothetical protein